MPKLNYVIACPVMSCLTYVQLRDASFGARPYQASSSKLHIFELGLSLSSHYCCSFIFIRVSCKAKTQGVAAAAARQRTRCGRDSL